MLIRKWSALLLAGIISALVGCAGPTTTVQNQPAPPPSAPPVSIAFSAAPPSSIFIGSKPSLTAIVTNDPLNAGVDWTVAPCANPDCGALSAPHTSSGQPVTYTPPTNLTQTSVAVKILAFASADHSKNVVAKITIETFSSVLKGRYVLQTSGLDIDPITGIEDVAHFAGVVVLDGNGGVTSGEQTYTNTSRSVSDPITSGSYFVGADGRGTLTLNTANPNLGQAGVETFDLVVLSSSQALILKNDPLNSLTQSNQSATGTMDLQTSANPPSQGYAFVVTGTDIASTVSFGATSPIGVGGVLNIDSPNSISGAGSIADQDLPALPQLTLNAAISGTVSNPDAFGAVQFTLSASFSPTSILFTGYIVDGNHIKLIETDVDSVNATGAASSGVAVGQGAATGTFKSTAAFAGNYIFGILGQDTSGSINFTPSASTLTSAGSFTATTTAALTSGFNEAFFGGLFVNLVDQFNGSCTLDIQGTGRLDCPVTYTVNGAGPEYIFYQVGNGNPPLVLDLDSNQLGGAGVGAGFAYLVSAPVSFNGDYGMILTQTSFGAEADFSGQIKVNGSAQTLAGTLDPNVGFVNPGPTGVTGSFAASSHPNIFSGTLDNSDGFLVPNALGTGIGVDYYFIDSGHGFLLETDLNDPTLQGASVAFGYFAARTPLCQGCP